MNSSYETLKINKNYKPQGKYPLVKGPCKSCQKGTPTFADTATNSVKCKGCNKVLVSGSTTLSPNIDSFILNNFGKDKVPLFYDKQPFVIKNLKPSNEPLLLSCVNCSKNVIGVNSGDTMTINCQECNKVIGSMSVTTN